MTVIYWLQLILLGGLAGTLGQGARIIVGVKKVNDQASATSQSLGDIIELSRLMISLLIGFVAGALAAVAISPIANIDSKTILAFAAAGYTGSDFIEGIMSRYVPSPAPKQPAGV